MPCFTDTASETNLGYLSVVRQKGWQKKAKHKQFVLFTSEKSVKFVKSCLWRIHLANVMLLQKLFICFLRKTCCSFVLVMTAFVCTYSGEVSSDHMWSTDACGDGLWCRCKLSSRRDAYWELYHLWMDHPGHALMPGANWRKVIPSQRLSQDLPRTLANKWEKQDISLTKAIFVFQGCQV